MSLKLVLCIVSNSVQPLLTKASSVLLGSVPVFVSNAEDLHSHLSIDSSELPMLLAWKDGHTKPAASMKLETTDNVEKLKLWLLRYVFFTLPK